MKGNSENKGGVRTCRLDADSIELTVSAIGAPSLAITAPPKTLRWGIFGKLLDKRSVVTYEDGGFVVSYGFDSPEDIQEVVDALLDLKEELK